LDIPRIIKDILTRREGLVVPGLGSFISEFQPASIGQDQKTIQPPRKKLRFDPSVREDADEILAGELVSREKITLDAAREKIKEYVDQIHNHLNREGRYEIEGLGVLEKKLAGAIEFRQAETPESNLGFEAISAEPFELESTREPTQTTPKTGKTPTTRPRRPSEKSTARKAGPTPPPQVTKKSGRRRVIWFSLLGVFILLLGFAGWYTGFYDYLLREWEQRQKTVQVTDTEKKKGEQEKSPQKTREKGATSDTSAKEAAIDQALDQMTDKKKALMYKEPVDTTNYHLIAGSFKKMANAREFQTQLKKMGYSSSVLNNEGLYRISVYEFDKKEDALVKLYAMRDTSELKSIWLLAVPEKDR
jgi:cell division protein FtsN/nucleoid DNA-binding protein